MGRPAPSRSGRSSRPAPARPPDRGPRERAAMNTTISPQVRILAVVGLLAAVGLGASLLVFGHGRSKTAVPAATTHATQRFSTQARTTTFTPHTPAKSVPGGNHTTKPNLTTRRRRTK